MRARAALAAVLGIATLCGAAAQQAPPAETVAVRAAAAPDAEEVAPQDALHADVLVVGGEPEAVSAAVAAAEEGARTVLLTSDARVGGLFVLGELNVLDLRTHPTQLQRGLFERWWARVGNQPAFDVDRAEAAFLAMLREAGVDVRTATPVPVPLIDADGRVLGARAGGLTVLADQIVDGEGDAGFAAAAGAAFTRGWSSIGADQRMADTLVFALQGVDWPELSAAVAVRGDAYASRRGNVVWGHFGGYPAAYTPSAPRFRLRGLNLGRESDGTVLVNALLVYGVDALDADSRESALASARAEIPAVVRYLASGIPGFAGARLVGTAPRLYVRESRHLLARCVLTADDVLDNRVTDQDVAAGGYPLDVQSLTPHDSGFVFGTPDVYGGRLCMGVPQGTAPLWVVGRSAGYDPIAFSSARVVPFGMSMAEAVGVAAARAARLGLDPAAVAGDPAEVSAVRARLAERGAYLPAVAPRAPVGPVEDPAYGAFRLLLSRGLAVGGYGNDPQLDTPVRALSFTYLLSNVAQRFFDDPEAGPALVARYGDADVPLTPAIALGATFDAACLLGSCPAEPTWGALRDAGLAPQGFEPTADLRRGDAYTLAAGVARLGLR